jgi:hypothetical protein
MAIYVYGLIILAALFLSGGLYFILMGIKDEPSDEEAVPISNPEEIRGLRGNFATMDKTETLQKGSFDDPQTSSFLHSVDENNNVVNEVDEGAAGESPNAYRSTMMVSPEQGATKNQDDLVALEKECERLQEALAREMASREVFLGGEDEGQKNQRLNEELTRVRKDAETAREENELLKQWRIDFEKLYAAIDEDFLVVKEQCERLLEEKNESVSALLQRVEAAERLVETASRRGQSEVDVLSEDNRKLRSRLLEATEQVRDFRMADERARARISELEATIHHQTEGIQLNSAHQEELEHVSRLQDAITRLESEKSAGLKQHVQLQEQYNRVVAINTRLMERIKLLQYELTKYRAQALGLEKIYQDLNTRIDRNSVISSG